MRTPNLESLDNRTSSIISSPPRHPGAVAVSGRGGRIGLEAQLGGCLGDAVDEGVIGQNVLVLW